jgi:hypothetical protein
VVAHIRSGFVLIALASGLRMWICWFSRPLSEVVVLAMPGAGLDTTPRVEVPPGAGELRLLVPGFTVGIFVDCHCVADGVAVMH